MGWAPLLMNERGEVAFVAGYYPDQSTFVRALWVYDRVRALRRVVYTGQVVTIGQTDYRISDFYLNDDSIPFPPDPAMFFNDDGVIAVPVDLGTGTPPNVTVTRAILRCVPDGYVDPVPVVDFWFNGANGDNWHKRGVVPPTSWENFDGTPRSEIPGDFEPNTASVFIPKNFFVVLDERPVPIGALQLDGTLAVHQLLTLNHSSKLNRLVVLGRAVG